MAPYLRQLQNQVPNNGLRTTPREARRKSREREIAALYSSARVVNHENKRVQTIPAAHTDDLFHL
jgi:hypothetical protein